MENIKNSIMKPSITFRLDTDVNTMLQEAISLATGKPVHGFKSALGNEALRKYLPTFLKAKTRKA